MKLGNMLSIPFALAADVLTFGNMGDRSFTQQVFDKDRRQQQFDEEERAAKLVVEIIRALGGKS